MKKLKPVQIAFLIMGIFIIEIIGLLQAVFSEQMIKFNLDTQVQYTSEMLLNQFKTSYLANENIQNGIKNFCYGNFDTGLVNLYKSLKAAYAVESHVKDKTYTGEDSLYHVEFHQNSEAKRRYYSEQLGLNVDAVKDYKILSYEMKQEERLLLGRRILVGLSDDRNWIISIEINQKEITTQMERTNRTMASLLNSAYYFSDKTGNFYVFSSNGNLLYQGGLEKNASYFGSTDLNSGKKIIDVIRQKQSSYKKVIYTKEDQVNHSIIRTIYDDETDTYFVYEMDQEKAFGKVERRIRQTWLIGLTVLIGTFVLLYLFWESHKRKRENGIYK